MVTQRKQFDVSGEWRNLGWFNHLNLEGIGGSAGRSGLSGLVVVIAVIMKFFCSRF